MRNMALAFVVVSLVSMLACLESMNSTIISMNKQIVTLQMDKEEIKMHTDQHAQIVKTQQYQLDVLTGMMEEK